MSTPEQSAPPTTPIQLPAAMPPTRCKNCDAVLLGRFCMNCSQAANVHVPSTLELMHELLEGLTHSDSRLWRTLTMLWFKPGKLTQEFIAGRRIAYLPPFRLYLILSIIFFLIASFTHTEGQVIHFDDGSKSVTSSPTGTSPAASSSAASGSSANPVTSCDDVNFVTFSKRPEWNARFKHACLAIVRDNGDSLLHIAIGTMSKAMFIFLPLVAFLHMLLYWRPRHRYAEHLLFFVHLHAFYFSVAILMISASNAAQTWPKLAGVSGVLETLLGWTLPIYTILAMRRVFQRGWAGTLFKAVVLFFVYMIMFGLTVAGVFVYAAFQL
jgi:hypothetical protein